FNVDIAWSVHANIADARVSQQWTKRSESEDFVEHVLQQNAFFHHGQRRWIGVDDFTNTRAHLGLRVFGNLRQTGGIQLATELIDDQLLALTNQGDVGLKL